MDRDIELMQSICHTSKVIWHYVMLKGKWKSKEIMVRQSVGEEGAFSQCEMVRSNGGCRLVK